MVLPDGKKLRICSAMSTEYRRIWTDRRTDGQTDGRRDGQTSHGIVRAMHTRRAVKTMELIFTGLIGVQAGILRKRLSIS